MVLRGKKEEYCYPAVPDTDEKQYNNYYNNVFIPYFLKKLEIDKDKYFTILKEMDEMDLLYFLINFEKDFNVTVNDYFINIKDPQILFDIMFRQRFKNEPKYTNAMNSWLEDLKENF